MASIPLKHARLLDTEAFRGKVSSEPCSRLTGFFLSSLSPRMQKMWLKTSII